MNVVKLRWQNSTIRRSLHVLPLSDRRKLKVVVLLQIGFSFLDLLGVLAIGLLGALSVGGTQSQKPSGHINSALVLLHIDQKSFQTQVAVLGFLAVFFLTTRTLLSITFTRRTIAFLSKRGADVSSRLVARILAQPMLVARSRTVQETLYSVTAGVEAITLRVLATCTTLISDAALLLVLTIGLFAIDPLMAVLTFLVFGITALTLYKLMHVRALILGHNNALLNIKSSEKIVEVFNSYRESVVRNRRDYYAREIGKLRHELAENQAEITFMPYIGKYVIESTVVLGMVVVGGVQFLMNDATSAVATLSVFLAAVTRIAPAVLRMQQGGVQIRSNLGLARPTLELIDSLGMVELPENSDDSVDLTHRGFKADIEIHGATFNYPEKIEPAISDVSIKIPSGAFAAFVGSSGAGKTTLIDILLGVLLPDQGEVCISGLPPHLAVAKWPGAISYVPQDVAIINGSIRENVAQGYPAECATDDLVANALDVACLSDFVSNLPEGVDAPVGEGGANLSGGEKQRLGIARAMFTNPHLLVMDEATSSLDGETEASISRALHALHGKTTVVMIAHRLSSIRHADLVVYMAEGKIVAQGTFDEVREMVPDFNKQASLMGL
jgi:ABC-type multidrug transport system fused ATPase/permease subunit